MACSMTLRSLQLLCRRKLTGRFSLYAMPSASYTGLVSARRSFGTSSGASGYNLLFSRPPPTSATLSQRIKELSDTVAASNWADYLILVQNMSFWEAELQALERAANDKHVSSEVTDQLESLQQMMDCMCRAVDLRDHAVEIMEQATRHTGIAGTGLCANEPVDNLHDHAVALAEAYDALLKEYPSFVPKLKDTLGQALALLRQKHRFDFNTMHQHFF